MLLLEQTASILEWGGVLILLVLVFVETGLLLGLIIPGGETLIFTAGLLVSTGTLHINILLLLLLLIVAGLAGDITGYFIGRKLGKKLFEKKDSRIFKQKYLKAAEKYMENHKRTAIIFGKFLPVIRPFTPVISGTTEVHLLRFSSLSLLAGIIYMSSFSLAGYFLGSKFPKIKEYLIYILPASILIAIVSVLRYVRKVETRN